MTTDNKRTLLDIAWKKRLKLRAEGINLWAEGSKLEAEGDKLWAEGRKLWAKAILETFGNIKLEWKNWNDTYKSFECHLENGLIFGFPE